MLHNDLGEGACRAAKKRRTQAFVALRAQMTGLPLHKQLAHVAALSSQPHAEIDPSSYLSSWKRFGIPQDQMCYRPPPTFCLSGLDAKEYPSIAHEILDAVPNQQELMILYYCAMCGQCFWDLVLRLICFGGVKVSVCAMCVAVSPQVLCRRGSHPFSIFSGFHPLPGPVVFSIASYFELALLQRIRPLLWCFKHPVSHMRRTKTVGYAVTNDDYGVLSKVPSLPVGSHFTYGFGSATLKTGDADFGHRFLLRRDVVSDMLSFLLKHNRYYAEGVEVDEALLDALPVNGSCFDIPSFSFDNLMESKDSGMQLAFCMFIVFLRLSM